MVTVLGLWEVEWMEAERTERRLWKQTIQAFDVDVWAMAPHQGGTFTSPVQYDDLTTMLAAYPGAKTFLIPQNTAEAASLSFIDLKDYTHPANPIYVFGSSHENLTTHVTESDDVVSICSPVAAHLFASSAMSAVVSDRCMKMS